MDSLVIFVDQLSNEPSPQRNNATNPLISTELSVTHTTEMLTTSLVAPPEQDNVTLDDDSNDPTFLYGFGAQQPIVPPSLNDLNLQPNPCNILTAMTVV